MLVAIILFVSLIAIAIGIVAYRSWFLQQVKFLNLELTRLDQEMDRGEQEVIRRRDAQRQLAMAVATFNYADLTAKKIEKLLKDKCKIPVPALPAPDAQGKVVMEQLGDILRVLHTHSIEIAGVEQVLLNVLSVPGSEVFGQITLAYFSGLFPRGLQEDAGSIVQQLAEGYFDNIASLFQYPLTDRRNEETLTSLPKPPDMGDSSRTMSNMSSGFALGRVATELLHNLIILYVTDPSGIVSLTEHPAPGQEILAHFLDLEHMEVYLTALSSLSGHLVPNNATVLHAASHLQHVQHAQHLQHADIGIDHLDYVSGFDAHFPSITSAISISREIALLKESKTNVTTSLENVSFDVLGTETEETVGGTIGTFLMPVSVLGTIVGSVAGDIGHLLSNRVKEEPFKELEAVVSALEREETAAAHQALRKVHLTASEKQVLLINRMEAIPKLDELKRRPLIVDASDLQMKASAFLQQARMLINSAKKYARDQSSSNPGIATLSMHLVQVEGKVRRAESMLSAGTLIQAKPLDVLESLSSMPIPLPGYIERVKEATHNAEQATTQYRKGMMTWSHQVMGTYLPVASDLKQVIESEGQKYKRTCDGFIAGVNEASARIKSEAEALGLA